MVTKKPSRGYIVMSVIVFGGVFALLLGGLVGFIFVQNTSNIIKRNREQARQIGEAGLDYYRWFLAHFPTDFTNGTGNPGPYEMPYTDPETGVVGTFSLDIGGETFCGITNSVEITSTGWTNDRPDITNAVYGKYARPSVAEYSFIINSNVWAGADRIIRGPYHSNGGVRMDGTNDSLVTSAVSEWLCTSSFGCSPQATTTGVWGDGPGFALWQYPVPQVDFVGITADLVELKEFAKDDGIYFEPTAKGRRLVFKDDGTVDAHIVTNTSGVWGYSIEDGWNQDQHIITNDTFVGNFTPPPDCPVIFAESDVWLEGEIKNKVTVVSANLIQANKDTSIILNDNVVYTEYDGSDGLTAIAEKHVLIPLLSPEDMHLDGIFIAQGGRFSRNHYTTTGSNDVPSQYDSYVQQDELVMIGTIVSNGRVGTKWTSGGTFTSGYENRENYYDRNLATNPPPLTPAFSNDFKFVEWRDLGGQ